MPQTTIGTTECARRLGISPRRVRQLISAEQILGARVVIAGNVWSYQIEVGPDGLPRTTHWDRGRSGRKPRRLDSD